MIGVVIPVHNEEGSLARCIASIRQSACVEALHGEPVEIVVVLDACTDGSRKLASLSDVTVLEVQMRNVGAARALGAQHCLARNARWLAFTDADTVVAPGWLASQLRQGCDVVCGTVGVEDWSDHGLEMPRHFAAGYTDFEGHRHIHGANLGVSAAAYLKAGGFQALACSEDVALVEALQKSGASIAWSALPRVVTSARKDFRCAGGFGASLLRIQFEAGLLAASAGC
jgi:glycosyltransferase involved in cell wall biosynthesis